MLLELSSRTRTSTSFTIRLDIRGHYKVYASAVSAFLLAQTFTHLKASRARDGEALQLCAA